MTPRDFAFWLQGFFELTEKMGPRATAETTSQWAQSVRDHATLVLKTSPKNGFTLACSAVADQPSALRDIVAAQFEHVIDKEGGWPEEDPAHAGGAMRC